MCKILQSRHDVAPGLLFRILKRSTGVVYFLIKFPFFPLKWLVPRWFRRGSDLAPTRPSNKDPNFSTEVVGFALAPTWFRLGSYSASNKNPFFFQRGAWFRDGSDLVIFPTPI